MPAPIKPNTEAAHEARRANARLRRIAAARAVLIEEGEPALARTDVIKMLEDPFYSKQGLTSAWLRGYFKIDD